MPDDVNLAKMLDHSLLQPSMTQSEMEQGIEVAKRYHVATVCILPYYVARLTEALQDSDVRPCCVIGFPHGTNDPRVKAFEASQAIIDGAEELDMVVNLSAVKSGDWNLARRDIQSVLDKVREGGAKLKVIFETAYLTDEEKIRLCDICSELRVDWVKTSTGYGPHGATVDDLRLMRAHSHAEVQVKASGGIRDRETALRMAEAGATRIGTSSTIAILDSGSGNSSSTSSY